MEWRGPAPHYFVVTPPDVSEDLRELGPTLTYGWGVIPARVRLGTTTLSTALFPRGEYYMVPLKVALRRAEGVELGDVVRLHLSVG